ncbi:hypermethylated in cancer 2 protein [Pleuronectes platessa]|uniref:hypermethylated in cancer 2 protein n=1 Tax=Pleuronectes platessa TaxID=8262 RepID=UPI00232A5FEC|nr:hypermethylated in cancer 2 protein [Pleuronectes platessa]
MEVLFPFQLQTDSQATSDCTPRDTFFFLLLFKYNMEASPCAQIVSSHTASLLMSLNLQRQRSQFCDCVVRQRQSPGQLYPAHRCVLAASSPVLSSILSSSGALVELQAPCLTGSVLALLLDYIYTGTLPFSRIQQYYYSLLTSACYLQMDELQEALRAWQKIKASDADKTNVSTGNESEQLQATTATTNSCSRHLPSTCSVDALIRHEETGGPLERVDRPYSCDEVQMLSTSLDSCIKSTETDTSGLNGANGCSSRCILSNCSSISEDNSDGVNTGKCTPVTYLTPQDFIQNIPDSAEEHVVSEVDKEVQKDQFHSAGTETWQKSTEEELQRRVEGKRKSSSPSSSSPHPYCEAVPVIRHSSRADMHQLAEVPPYHSISKVSVDSSRAAVPRLASKDIDDIAEGVTPKQTNPHGEQDQDDGI